MIKVCRLCAGDFEADPPQQQYCQECMRHHKDAIDERYRIVQKINKQKKLKAAAALRAKSTPSKTIDEMVREINAYNARHNENLSYGKYVEKMTLGLLKD